MPRIEPRRRSRAHFEEDDDDAPSPSGSDTSKRQKYDIAEDSDGQDSEQQDRRVRNSKGSSRRPRTNRHSSITGINGDTDEYHPGAIVRVMVDDFVTYEHAEFLPGPNLNMVIGPNGTGKSSLVCAICLGLGYHPKHLGRASHVGEFVKYGKESATIEVELQKRPNERANHVIRLQIRKEDNGRKFWLNGRESTHKAVQELTRNLRIQIDNLCQFLPQDKVAEFAGLTPVQLLHETLRAAAPEEMVNWQSQLKDLHQDHKKVKEQVDTCSETLRGHETRQQGLQADVDRIREREAIQERVGELESARAVAEYNDYRRQFNDAKKRRDEAKKQLQDLERACGPALEAVNRKQDYAKSIEPVVEERKKALKNAEAVGDRLLHAIEAQSEKIKEAQDEKDAAKGTVTTKTQRIDKTHKAVKKLEEDQKKKPPEFVAADWNRKIRAKQELLQENEAKKRELQIQLDDVKANFGAKTRDIEVIQQKQEALESQQGQMMAFLIRFHADAAKGWEWLQEHQEDFEKEVFGPPMLSCSVKDNRYSDHVQALLGQDDFCCFITQTRNDHKKLSDQLYRQMGLSVTIRTCMSDFASFQPVISKDQIKGMGIDGYAIDFLEGPDPVLAMLCTEKRLHNSGIGLKDVNNEQYSRLMSCGIPSWATGQTQYRVARRKEYGPDAVSTTTKRIMAGRFWKEQATDDTEKAELKRQLDEAVSQHDEIKEQGRTISAELKELKDGDGGIRQDLDALKAEKNELQKVATLYATLPDKINHETRALEKARADLAECKERMLQYGAQEDQLIVEKARLVLQHKEQLPKMRDVYEALLKAHVRLIEARSDVKGLEDRNSDIKQRLEEARAEIDVAKGEIDRWRAEASRAKEKVEEALAGNQGILTRLNELAAGKTAQELEDEINAEQGKLEFIRGVDPNVLRQFEKRAQEIQTLIRREEELTAKLESLGGQMERLMQRWEPRVDELISKINDAFAYNFEQISCAGEVGVHKDEDFEQWAIEIKVKFRENETLQQLTQHRQSGGERAVSTIFYLMALQSMAQAPFRVVDEINQGMDPRNERMVHERMVEIACREHTSQYFLITPKLLTGLRYDEKMRVLCIASGEHMPAEGRKLDFGRLVGIRRAIAAAA